MREPVELALLTLVAIAAIGAAVHTFRANRKDPNERERRRRLAVHREGRILDGFVIDVHENTLCYQYSFRGVEYTASQDISTLRDRLPDDLNTLVGPVTLKFLTRNPVNSIIVCEEWSGFRKEQFKKGA